MADNTYKFNDYTGDQIKTILDNVNQFTNGAVSGNNQLKDYIDTLDDTKADKDGPLPRYTVNIKDNVYDFVVNNDLSGKACVLKFATSTYLAGFTKLSNTIYFELKGTGLVSNSRYQGSCGNNKTFKNIIAESYKNNFELEKNKVTSLSSSSTDTQYPSAKAVYDFVKYEPNLIETTWAALKDLRDDGELIPGKFYRITDYECTTTQANTSSANHQFDIIVRADSYEILNEEASAILHDGDTYFANNKLEAWKLWYCLDNDRTRFAWADAYAIVLGTTMYFRNPSKDDIGKTYGYAWTSDSDTTLYTDTDTPTTETKAHRTTEGGFEYSISDVHEVTGKGIIYRMIDEFGNDISYDFKNILFTWFGKYTNAYTFSYTENNEIKDASILNSTNTHDNIIKGSSSQRTTLNFNVFYSEDLVLNCNTNIINYDSYYNFIKKGFYQNNIGPSFIYNIINNNCSRNSIGSLFNDNKVGEGFYSNHIGNNVGQNIFGKSVASNDFGTFVKNSNFGQSVDDPIYLVSSHIGPSVRYINLVASSEPQSTKDYVQNIHIHSGVTGTSNVYKTITVDRNLAYETNIVPAGTTTIEV